MSDTYQDLIQLPKFNVKKYSNQKHVKHAVLNYLLKNISIVNGTKYELKKMFTEDLYNIISEKTSISVPVVKKTIKHFELNIIFFRKFLTTCKFKYDPKKDYRKIRIYLHKVHKLAPVFDYDRAKQNIEPFLKLSQKNNLIPQISTQLACIIFITNKKGKDNLKLIQKNIRLITGCSAYAFHRTRNKLQLNDYL